MTSVAEQFSAGTGKTEVADHLKNVTELCYELNTRWLQVTQRVFEAQNELLARCAEAADKAS